jgi:hypothetical protein
MPVGLADIANEMERTYITNEQWYRVQETWWMATDDDATPDKSGDMPDG